MEIGWGDVGGMDFGWKIGLVVVGSGLVGKNFGGLENVLFCQPNVLWSEFDVFFRQPNVLLSQSDVHLCQPNVLWSESDVLWSESDVL